MTRFVLSLFDGMSCGQLALAGRYEDEYYASEIDKYAIQVTKANFPNTIHLGDVSNWRHWDIPWSCIDLILAGSPCQGFSFIGQNLAFDDPRSALFFVLVDIINHVKSVNPDVKFLVENVKMAKKHSDVFTEKLGIAPLVINSKDVIGQLRERWYWFNWEATFEPATNPSQLDLPMFVRRHGNMLPRTDGNATCIDANYFKGLDNHGQRTVVLEPSGLYRKLTPEECEFLQTVPIGYTAGVSNTQRYKMLGNGWTVEVVKQLLNQLPKA